MGDDNAEAQRRRAAMLREQIARVTGGRSEPGATEPDRTTPAGPEESEAHGNDARRPVPRVHPLPSPREFIRRRMRELDDPHSGTDDEDGKG